MSGWLVVLLAAAGHAEWWVIAVNRLHAFPIHAPKLRRFRMLHDIAVPAFPLLLVAVAGFGEQGLLNGGSPAQQPATIQLLLACAVSGCIPLLLGIIRWHASGRRAFLAADARTLLNLRDTHPNAQTTPQASPLQTVMGLPRTLARIWPLNEFVHLELNRKSICIPATGPTQNSTASQKSPLRSLRLLHFSDLHFTGTPGMAYYREFVRLAQQHPADAIFFTGDLIDDPTLLQEAIEILRPLTQTAPCWFILGNHDWRYDHQFIRHALENSGWKCAVGNGLLTQLNGIPVFIAGSERPWMGSPPPDARNLAADLKILLCHTPDGQRTARSHGYQLMLSGHTHGGQVVLPLIGPVYSPSFTGVRFASGLFTWPNFTLHVSRGVGSKDPLRWNCPPELTWLDVTFQPPAP